MRAFGTYLIGGTVAILILKTLWAIALPAVGILFGILAIAFKFALLAGAAYLVYSLIFKRRKREVEVEVEVE